MKARTNRSRSTRRYVSEVRQQAAEATRASILSTARKLFVRHGIDKVTIAQIAQATGVAPSTIYAVYRSKEGVLRAIMRSTLFGERFQQVQSKLQGVTDPVRLIALSAHVARAIYEGESSELGLMRGSAAFSPALRKLEQEFEKIRFDMQEERVKLLFEHGRQRKGLRPDEARRILWMYTSRDVYRMLVHEAGWTPDRYQEWLSEALVDALVET
jgi:AcrR family transcriptional regulator